MRQIIYSYLNDSLGTEVYLKSNADNSFYNIFSKKGPRIITFRIQNDWEYVKLFRCEELTQTISSLFSISNDDASLFVKDWFGEIHNLEKVGDLRKLVHNAA